MPQIQLFEENEKALREIYTHEGYVAPKLKGKVDFVDVKTVKLTTLVTRAYNPYNRSGPSHGYGAAMDIATATQLLTLSQDVGFKIQLDHADYVQTGMLLKAGTILGSQIREQGVPMKDKYALGVLSANAGNIVGNGTALTAATVLNRLRAARTTMANKKVPISRCMLFLPASVYGFVMDAEVNGFSDKVAADVLGKGAVGSLWGIVPVIEVPDDFFPVDVNFILADPAAVAMPQQIDHSHIETEPEDFNGVLIKHREIFDTFVIGAKADGVYVEVKTATGGNSVLAAPVIDAEDGAITGTGGTVYYTTDGTDPRYSSSAQIGKDPVLNDGAATIIKAYIKGSGKVYSSPVATVTVPAVAG